MLRTVRPAPVVLCSSNYCSFQNRRVKRKINRNIENPAAQIVKGLLFTNSRTSKEPENSIPITDTRRTSFRPVPNTIFPIDVNRTMISIMVYMVNPYMQDGMPSTRVHPPFRGHELDRSTPVVR